MNALDDARWRCARIHWNNLIANRPPLPGILGQGPVDASRNTFKNDVLIYRQRLYKTAHPASPQSLTQYVKFRWVELNDTARASADWIGPTCWRVFSGLF
jgi:hypothetical protein